MVQNMFFLDIEHEAMGGNAPLNFSPLPPEEY